MNFLAPKKEELFARRNTCSFIYGMSGFYPPNTTVTLSCRSRWAPLQVPSSHARRQSPFTRREYIVVPFNDTFRTTYCTPTRVVGGCLQRSPSTCWTAQSATKHHKREHHPLERHVLVGGEVGEHLSVGYFYNNRTDVPLLLLLHSCGEWEQL